MVARSIILVRPFLHPFSPSLELIAPKSLLGVQAYAVKHYEACLALATIERQAKMAVDDGGEGQDVDFGPHDFAPLAAYNLSNLYVVSGSPELARVVARKWLVF